MKTLFILLILLAGCVTNKPTSVSDIVNESVAEKIQRFEKIFKVKANVNVIFETFSNTPYKKRLGGCLRMTIPLINNIILIDPNDFILMSESRQEVVIFHELGHCVLGLDHTFKRMRDGDIRIEGSLMFLVVMSDSRYKKHREYYIEELKQRYLLKKKGLLKDEIPND